MQGQDYSGGLRPHLQSVTRPEAVYADPLEKLVGSRPALVTVIGVVYCQKHVILLNNLFFYLGF